MKLSGPAASQAAVAVARRAVTSNFAIRFTIAAPLGRSGLLAEIEGLGGRPGIGRRNLLARDLLDLGRRQIRRKGAAPLVARFVTDLADIGDEVPDHAVGQHAAPGRHSVWPPLVDRE